MDCIVKKELAGYRLTRIKEKAYIYKLLATKNMVLGHLSCADCNNLGA